MNIHLTDVNHGSEHVQADLVLKMEPIVVIMNVNFAIMVSIILIQIITMNNVKHALHVIHPHSSVQIVNPFKIHNVN